MSLRIAARPVLKRWQRPEWLWWIDPASPAWCRWVWQASRVLLLVTLIRMVIEVAR